MASRTGQADNPKIWGLIDHMSVMLDGRIVVFGGKPEPRAQSLYRDCASHRVIWTLNPETECWMTYKVPADEPVPPPTVISCGAVINSHVYMFGGYLHTEEQHVMRFSNALWKLQRTKTKQFSWTPITFENNFSQPSPRADFTAWEYDDKLWIFGGLGLHFDGFMHDNKAEFRAPGGGETGDFGSNNQIFAFDPSCGRWSIPDTRGKLPPAIEAFSAARIGDKVWLYSARSGDMYVLHMRSLTWWSPQNILGVPPAARQSYTFTALSDGKIILHGGLGYREPLSDTWIFDTDLSMWEQHTASQDHVRYEHAAVKVGNNRIVIIGGLDICPCIGDDLPLNTQKDIYWVRFEPDSLRKQCLKVVLEHVDVTKLTPMDIPNTLLDDLQEMYMDFVMETFSRVQPVVAHVNP